MNYESAIHLLKLIHQWGSLYFATMFLCFGLMMFLGLGRFGKATKVPRGGVLFGVILIMMAIGLLILTPIQHRAENVVADHDYNVAVCHMNHLNEQDQKLRIKLLKLETKRKTMVLDHVPVAKIKTLDQEILQLQIKLNS